MTSKTMMFKIDNTDFFIDPKKSRFKLRIKKDGSATIDADIYGDQARYEVVTADDDSPWSWTLYPPHFYIRSFPAKIGRIIGTARAQVAIDDLSEYDAAIYLMEHNDIENVVISAEVTLFKAKGIVLLSGDRHDFSIKFTKP